MAAGAAVDVRSIYGKTPLRMAAELGSADVAKFLIDAGARTDLFYYAMTGNINVIRPAILHNPSMTKEKGPHGISLMFHAAISGSPLLTQLLFDHDATVDDNCLRASVTHGRSYPMTLWLLERGARYYGQKAFGNAPLAEWAKNEGLTDISNLLDQHYQPRIEK